jgi:folate-binding protein YgfZ
VQTDLNIYVLPDEILLDFEPGYTASVSRRLEQFVIAEEVQVVDAAPFYGMLSVQGPRSAEVMETWGWGADRPSVTGDIRCWRREGWGDLYLACQPRLGTRGFDLFLPLEAIAEVSRGLEEAVRAVGGLSGGADAFEVARVESGIPRYGVDLDDSNLAPETGMESRAICYTKGCYVGQEVIARIRTYGQVARQLKQLRLPEGLAALPGRGERLFRNGREVGSVTSAVHSVRERSNLALGYVRREAALAGTELQLGTPEGGQVRVL